MNSQDDQHNSLHNTQLAEADDAVIGKAFKWSLAAILLIAASVGSLVWIAVRPTEKLADRKTELALPEVRTKEAESLPSLPFSDITQSANISFRHENGATGEKLLPETMGGGCAFLDYDSDGDQDLLLVNSCHWPDRQSPSQPTSALYSNDGLGNFQEVTEVAGLDVVCYGMGVAVGDYDNDGDPDLFLSTVGKNLLFRNDSGKFTDVSAEARVEGDPDRWSTSCGWFDYDNDGDLDLLVGNYVEWTPQIDLAQDFRLTGIGRAYGPPFSFQGTFPYLYRNEGTGTFTDVSEACGIQQTNLATDVPLAKTLGVAPCDIDRDGWIDFILANDTVQNSLFINGRDGTFRDVGIEAGIAFDAGGKARGAMGIDVGCFRNDDCLGIAVGNFANEMSALYVSAGESLGFTDDAIPSGLGPQTRGDLCFGLFFFDADLDGRLDLFTANGHLEEEINLVQKSQHYRQPPRLFWNAGSSGFSEYVNIPASSARPASGALNAAGLPNASGLTGLAEPLVGRGAAFADIDADGDLDVVVTQIGGRPALLRNDQATGHHFLRFKLVGTSDNRDAIGAWIEVRQGERVIRRQVMPTRSYLSQVELPVTIGLGREPRVDQVMIRWPNGSEQKINEWKIDAVTILEQPSHD